MTIPSVKILLVRLDHLGDLVLTTPLVRALAKAGHAVELVVPRNLLPILEGNPHVGSASAIEEIAPEFPVRWRPLRDWMRAEGYDAILLPNARPRELLWASGGSGVRTRLAMQAGIWGRVTGHRCLRVRDSMMRGRHFSDLQLDLARALNVPTDGLKPDYFCREEETARARETIRAAFPGWNGEALIGIHPGWLGNTCNLPSGVYAELAALILARTDARIVLTGTAEEHFLLDSWPKEILGSPRVHDGLGALDLRSLAALISQLAGYIIGSTGPLHLASALGVRTLSPFCALPPLCASIWGNVGGPSGCVQPGADSCRRWQKGVPAHRHCDFRGEVTAEILWDAWAQRESILL